MNNVDFDDGSDCASCGDRMGRTYKKVGTRKWYCPECFMALFGRRMVIE